MVGMTGLEPAASCSQSKHSTKLSYIPGGSSGIYVYFREVKSISFVLPEPMSKKWIPSIEGGWASWIRTSGMVDSKSTAVPLGYDPVFFFLVYWFPLNPLFNALCLQRSQNSADIFFPLLAGPFVRTYATIIDESA